MILKIEPEPKIAITLSMDEASQLQGLLYLIGGDPKKHRKFFQELSDELGRLGVLPHDLKCERGRSSIYLKDHDDE